MKKTLIFLLCFVSITMFCMPLCAEEETLQDPRLKDIYREIRTLVKRYYPEATTYLLKNKIQFDYSCPTKNRRMARPVGGKGP
jgi:hypothetical protein